MSDRVWDFETTQEADGPRVPAPPDPRTPAPPGVQTGGFGVGVDRPPPIAPPERPRPATLPGGRPPTAPPPMGAAAPAHLPPTSPPGGDRWQQATTDSPRFESVSTGAHGPGATDPTSTRGSRWGWRAFVAFLAGGMLAAGGFAAAQVGDDESASAPSTSVRLATDQPAAPAIVVEPPDVDTSEPAAFVAQVLGPSIVQVEIPNVGLGSGVVFDEGLILTNHHVIDGSNDVQIRTADGRLLEGQVVGSDERTDIAVIDVGGGSGLPIAQLAVGEPLEVGQLTIAIGSPFQLQQTVTSGIISSLNRPVFNGVGLNAMIQTDAAINPGTSGGALADRNARVIGIDTAIQTDGLTQGNVGVGFAVPIDTAMSIAGRLSAGEPLEAGFLGVSGGPSEDGSSGVNVVEVTDGSSADDAGLLVGDRIISIDGAPVTDIEELAGLVQTRFPGDQVELELVRDGERLVITATLGQR